MGSFQVIGLPGLKAKLLQLNGVSPLSLTGADAGTGASAVLIDLDKLRYSIPWNTADSKGKTNLLDPTKTMANDGDLSTYVEASSSSTSAVDMCIKLDMGAIDSYIVAIKVGIWQTSSTLPTATAIVAASPDNTTWTTIISKSTNSMSETIFYGAAVVSGYRYFKVQGYISSPYTFYVRVYELAIWAW
jgi:hypothetical protein